MRENRARLPTLWVESWPIWIFFFRVYFLERAASDRRLHGIKWVVLFRRAPFVLPTC